jgi:predicted nucleic acid-binding protein
MVDDPLTAAAIEAAETHVAEAPFLLCSEVANALRNHHRAGRYQLDWCQQQLRRLPRLVRLHDERPLLPFAFRLAAERDHAVYDCIYVAMAIERAMPLITADRKLARKFEGLPGLDLVELTEAMSSR